MKLAKKDVEKVCKDYCLGNLKSFKLIKEGLINHNFDVRTEKGIFILRILKKGKGPRQKDNEFKALQFLTKNNYSYKTPIPILNKKNKKISRLKNRNVWVYKKLEGEHIKKCEVRHLRQVAKALAEYHKIIKKLGKIDNPPKWWTNLNWVLKEFEKMKKIKPKNNIDRLMLKNVDYVESLLKKYALLKHPKNFLLCHCDFNKSNLLWKKDKLVAVLDFDNCSYRPRIFDIAYAISQFCNKNSRIDQKKMQVFLQQYQKNTQLTKTEINQIFPMILRHQAMIFEWFYNGIQKNKQNTHNYMKWGIEIMKSADEILNSLSSS